MTRDEAVAYITEWLKDEYALNDKDREALQMAISALEQEPCEDAVSREAVLNCFTATKLKKFDFILYAREEIKKLPSVTRQTGKWIYRRGDKYSCSKCGTTTSVDEAGIDEKPMYKFCPYCGADMRGESE